MIPIHPGHYSPWTVTSPDYRLPQVVSACGSAQHPALFGDGVGDCASVQVLSAGSSGLIAVSDGHRVGERKQLCPNQSGANPHQNGAK